MNIFLALFAVVILVAGIRWLLLRAPQQGPGFLFKFLFALLLLVIVALAVTGRLHWLAGLLAGLLPFARRLLPLLLPLLRLLPFVQQQRQRQRSRQRTQGQHSDILTATLQMTLDHDSGEMDGTILKGPFAGQRLNDLPLPQLRQYYAYCQQQDDEAVRLLDAYLRRRFQEQWQEGPEEETATGQGEKAKPASGGNDDMSREEAFEILGLAPGATREEIIRAHKRMMLRVHPDRGGSNYLAIKINQAKEVLLERS